MLSRYIRCLGENMLRCRVHLTSCTWLEVSFHLPWYPLQWVGALKGRARNIVFVIVFTLPSNISSSQNIKHPHHHCHNFHHELCGKLSYNGTFSGMCGPCCGLLLSPRIRSVRVGAESVDRIFIMSVTTPP